MIKWPGISHEWDIRINRSDRRDYDLQARSSPISMEFLDRLGSQVPETTIRST